MAFGVTEGSAKTPNGRCTMNGHKPDVNKSSFTSSALLVSYPLVSKLLKETLESANILTASIALLSPLTTSAISPLTGAVKQIRSFFLSVKRQSPAFTSSPCLTFIFGTRPLISVGLIANVAGEFTL